MFQESLIESLPPTTQRSRWPALASIGLQTALVATLLIVPILHPEILPIATPRLSVLPSPVLRPTPPPPQRVIMRTSETSVSPSPVPAPPTQAQQLPRPSFTTDEQPVDMPLLAFGNPGPPSADPPSVLTATVSGASGTGTATGPASASSAPRQPLSISTGVMAGRLLAPIQPAYPPIARIAHAEGSVVIQAIISKTGRIESAHIVSGPPLLQSAALDAVREARYRPFLLNNQPTEVETTITIHFRLGSGDGPG
jgi:protein TonB